MSLRLSPDGMYYWDGQAWVSTLSHDGRFRWNGQQWVPVGGLQPVLGAGAGSVREPTSWTRPLQLGVAALFAVDMLFWISYPFWTSSMVGDALQQSFQRQQTLNPEVSPPPQSVIDAMTTMTTDILWVFTVFAVAVCVLGAVAALRRWGWAYYVTLVLFGLGIFGLLNIVYLFVPPPASALYGFSLPAWTYWLSSALALADTAVFVLMLVALVRFGPWAMRRIS